MSQSASLVSFTGRVLTNIGRITLLGKNIKELHLRLERLKGEDVEYFLKIKSYAKILSRRIPPYLIDFFPFSVVKDDSLAT